jgi:response regulator RpfG family c-di-GMP phosphodiesterase
VSAQDSSKPRILLVDDEPDLTAAVVRSLRSERFEFTTATGGAEAIAVLRDQGPFAVVVSDLVMPGMNGVDLLGSAQKISPDTVRVLFTGQPDLERAIAAVNEGAIFRFITKPCSRVTMALVLKRAVEQYELVTAQRVLLEQTLHGSVRALTEVLGLASPLAFGRATRLRHATRALVSAVGPAEAWQVEVAAMLSQIGWVTVPPAVLEKVHQGQSLTEEEEVMVRRVPEVGEQVLANIPRLDGVRDILRCLKNRFDGSGQPSAGDAGEAIPWGTRALKLILDLDKLETEGIPLSLAFDTLRGRKGCYDPAILEALANVRNADPSSDVRELPLTSLRPGMFLAQDVRTRTGVLFSARGQEVTPSLLEKFRNYAPGLRGTNSIRVVVP